MTSFLDAIALEDRESSVSTRKATVLAKQRVDHMYGAFIKRAGREAFDYAGEDIEGVVKVACDEVGCDDFSNVYKAVADSLLGEHVYQANSTFGLPNGENYSVTARTAGIIHEARKPKMCPFHRDVVDISLAAGDARAGFDSMAQHWGGPR